MKNVRIAQHGFKPTSKRRDVSLKISQKIKSYFTAPGESIPLNMWESKWKKLHPSIVVLLSFAGAAKKGLQFWVNKEAQQQTTWHRLHFFSVGQRIAHTGFSWGQNGILLLVYLQLHSGLRPKKGWMGTICSHHGCTHYFGSLCKDMFSFPFGGCLVFFHLYVDVLHSGWNGLAYLTL